MKAFRAPEVLLQGIADGLEELCALG